VFILYAVVVGLVGGLLAGGRVGRLASLQFRWAPLILAGFLVQVVLFTDQVAARIGDLGPPIYVGSTVVVVVAVARNLALPGIPLVVAGAISNLAAIVANGGYMPAEPGALASLGKTAPAIYSNSAVVSQPSLELLTDRFALPAWVPFTNVFSVGDVLLGFGVVVLIVVAMRRGPGPDAIAGQEDRPGHPDGGGAARQLPLSS
jgi:hypothetical protein